MLDKFLKYGTLYLGKVYLIIWKSGTTRKLKICSEMFWL